MELKSRSFTSKGLHVAHEPLVADPCPILISGEDFLNSEDSHDFPSKSCVAHGEYGLPVDAIHHICYVSRFFKSTVNIGAFDNGIKFDCKVHNDYDELVLLEHMMPLELTMLYKVIVARSSWSYCYLL